MSDYATFNDLYEEHAEKHGLHHDDDGGDLACAEAVGKMIGDIDEDLNETCFDVPFYHFYFRRNELFPASSDAVLEPLNKRLRAARGKAHRDAEMDWGEAVARVMQSTGAVARYKAAVQLALSYEAQMECAKANYKKIKRQCKQNYEAVMKAAPRAPAAAD